MTPLNFMNDEEAGAMFSYRVLKVEEIRVLEPVQIEGPLLSFRLVHVTRGSVPYAALSYTWGDEAPTKSIWVDGKMFSVRPNLFQCLASICQSSKNDGETQYLWVDAICIDQADIGEKNEQVRRMGVTYSQASKVCVWLGAEPESFAAVENDSTNRMILYSDYSFFQRHIEDLANRAYWTRFWVIQEFTKGNNVYLHCGTYIIDWSTFERIFIEGPLLYAHVGGHNRDEHYLNLSNSLGNGTTELLSEEHAESSVTAIPGCLWPVDHEGSPDAQSNQSHGLEDPGGSDSDPEQALKQVDWTSNVDGWALPWPVDLDAQDRAQNDDKDGYLDLEDSLWDSLNFASESLILDEDFDRPDPFYVPRPHMADRTTWCEESKTWLAYPLISTRRYLLDQSKELACSGWRVGDAQLEPDLSEGLSKSKSSLYYLLVAHRHSKCQDPRDRVFSLLSLLGDREREKLSAFPDYDLSHQEVVIFTLTHLLRDGLPIAHNGPSTDINMEEQGVNILDCLGVDGLDACRCADLLAQAVLRRGSRIRHTYPKHLKKLGISAEINGVMEHRIKDILETIARHGDGTMQDENPADDRAPLIRRRRKIISNRHGAVCAYGRGNRPKKDKQC